MGCCPPGSQPGRCQLRLRVTGRAALRARQAVAEPRRPGLPPAPRLAPPPPVRSSQSLKIFILLVVPVRPGKAWGGVDGAPPSQTRAHLFRYTSARLRQLDTKMNVLSRARQAPPANPRLGQNPESDSDRTPKAAARKCPKTAVAGPAVRRHVHDPRPPLKLTPSGQGGTDGCGVRTTALAASEIGTKPSGTMGDSHCKWVFQGSVARWCWVGVLSCKQLRQNTGCRILAGPGLTTRQSWRNLPSRQLEEVSTSCAPASAPLF